MALVTSDDIIERFVATADDQVDVVCHDAPGVNIQTFHPAAVVQAVNHNLPRRVPGESVDPADNCVGHEVKLLRIAESIFAAHAAAKIAAFVPLVTMIFFAGIGQSQSWRKNGQGLKAKHFCFLCQLWRRWRKKDPISYLGSSRDFQPYFYLSCHSCASRCQRVCRVGDCPSVTVHL